MSNKKNHRGKLKEEGLGVFILKRKAITLGIVDSLLSMIEEAGFLVLRRKDFHEKDRYYIAEHLRGGNWRFEGETIEELLPSVAVVVLDAYSNFAGSVERIMTMKDKLCGSFDQGGASVIHSSDTILEAWKFIILP